MITPSKECPLISVVVPVFNEEKNIEPFLSRCVPIVDKLGSYEIIFVMDPGEDETENIIKKNMINNERISLIIFSRRFGQPAAMMAGIMNCKGSWCVVIDVDLQDPPELISELFKKTSEGFDVVAARRTIREGETLLKKMVASVGYKVINRIADVSIPENTGDFRIISRRVIEELRGLSESHGFLRGLVSLVGFPQTEILYQRSARNLGHGKYNRYLGSLKIGFNGIFGFSTYPLQLMMWSGFAISIFSAFLIFLVIALKIIHRDAYPMGVPTLTILTLFIGGIQLSAIGILGEYIGRIYEEVRRRPHYIINKAYNIDIVTNNSSR